MGKLVPDNSKVFIKYVVEKSNLPEKLDELYKNLPTEFVLGSGEMFQELETGIKTMQFGENSRFIINPESAPDNATIQYNISYVSYLRFSTIKTNPEEKFHGNVVLAKQLQIEGDERLALGNPETAIFKYTWAKSLLLSCQEDSYDHKIEIQKHLNTLFARLSVCYLRTFALYDVCQMGMEALKYSESISKHNANIFCNWGKALRLLKAFAEADDKLQTALKLKPSCTMIKNEIQKLSEDREFSNLIEPLKHRKDADEAVDMFCYLQPFWDMLDSRLANFAISNEEILTIKLNSMLDNIDIIKRKVLKWKLKFQYILKSHIRTDCIAITKSDV